MSLFLVITTVNLCVSQAFLFLLCAIVGTMPESRIATFMRVPALEEVPVTIGASDI